MRSWIVLSCVLWSFVATAKVEGGRVDGEPLYGELAWSEAGEARKAWLDPKAIVELDATAEGRKAVLAIDRAATSRNVGKARLWRLSTDGGRVLEKLASTAPRGRFHAVHRDAPSTTGRARALTGELLVTVATAQVPTARKLLASKLLEVVKALPAPPGTFRVRPMARVDPIVLASKLEGAPGIVSATPNWWLEVAPR